MTDKCGACGYTGGAHHAYCIPNPAASANDRQEGGEHYTKKAIQPWEVIEANDMDFFEGNALKYLMRWRDKAGVADLKKCAHYVQKLIERAEAGKYERS